MPIVMHFFPLLLLLRADARRAAGATVMHLDKYDGTRLLFSKCWQQLIFIPFDRQLWKVSFAFHFTFTLTAAATTTGSIHSYSVSFCWVKVNVKLKANDTLFFSLKYRNGILKILLHTKCIFVPAKCRRKMVQNYHENCGRPAKIALITKKPSDRYMENNDDACSQILTAGDDHRGQ